MSNCMEFPKDYNKFIDDYSFEDNKQIYTNGGRLIPVFRVYQMIRNYFNKDDTPTEIHYLEDNADVFATIKGMSLCSGISVNAKHFIMTALGHDGQIFSYDLAPNLNGIDYIEVNGVKYMKENSK